MRLVGHVEQMHEAKCYQEDPSFTCNSCHDPHRRPAPSDRAQFYRSKCLQCHVTDNCNETPVNRNRKQDDCIACHMPRASVLKQSHLSLHQHRVGIYQTDDLNLQHSEDPKANQVTGSLPADLKPILDLHVDSREERERLSALAIFQLSEVPLGSISDVKEWQRVATEKLIGVHAMNKQDSAVSAALAKLAYAQGQVDIAANLASDLLQQKEGLTAARIDAMEILARWAWEHGDWKNAAKVYRRLDLVRLDATDAYYLGLCEKQLGNASGAIESFQKSIRISPVQTGAYLELAALLKSEGKRSRPLHRLIEQL